MTNNAEIILAWKKFGMDLISDENPECATLYPIQSSIPESWKIWNKFGVVMLVLRGNSEFPFPSGSECRDWARAFALFYNGITETTPSHLIEKFEDISWVMKTFYSEISK